ERVEVAHTRRCAKVEAMPRQRCLRKLAVALDRLGERRVRERGGGLYAPSAGRRRCARGRPGASCGEQHERPQECRQHKSEAMQAEHGTRGSQLVAPRGTSATRPGYRGSATL